MKKLFLVLISSMLLLLLTACDSDDGQTKSNDYTSDSVENQESSPISDTEMPTVELTEEEQIDADLRAIVQEKYSGTDVDRISLNKNLGTEDNDSDYVALVYLTWTVKNKPDTTKKMLAMYSEDFAARIGENISAITEFTVFWTVPYYSETDTAAKYSYKREDAGMYQTDAMVSEIIK